MGIPKHETIPDIPDRARLAAVPDISELTLYDVYAPYARTHPALPELQIPPEDKLYGSLIVPNRTDRLRMLLHGIEVAHPAIEGLSASAVTKDFAATMNRTITTHGITEKYGQHQDDLTITQEQLERHAEDQRYRAVAVMVIAVLAMDKDREAEEKRVIGTPEIQHIGQLALFAVDPAGFTADFKDIIKARALARESDS